MYNLQPAHRGCLSPNPVANTQSNSGVGELSGCVTMAYDEYNARACHTLPLRLSVFVFVTHVLVLVHVVIVVVTLVVILYLLLCAVAQ